MTRRSVDALAQAIADGIARGRWTPLLPFQRDLAAELGVGSEQVRRALELLRERGVVERGYTEHGRWPRWVPTGACRVYGSRAEVVAADIAQRLADGRWRALPPVVAIAAELAIGHERVSEALRLLEARGRVAERAAWSGTAPKWVALDAAGRPVIAETARDEALRRARERIATGEWAMVPTVQARARELGVSVNLAKAVTGQLAAEGLIRQIRLRGGSRWVSAAHAFRYTRDTVAGLAEFIEQKITSGEWTVLPSIKELGSESGLTAPTVVRALRQLADRGLVAKYVGPGVPGGHRWVITGGQRP